MNTFLSNRLAGHPVSRLSDALCQSISASLISGVYIKSPLFLLFQATGTRALF